MLPDLPQDGQHGHVRLSGAGGSAKKDVLVRVKANLGQFALDAVKLLEALEGSLSVGRQGFDGDKLKKTLKAL